jgi:hypothetical protein
MFQILIYYIIKKLKLNKKFKYLTNKIILKKLFYIPLFKIFLFYKIIRLTFY